MNQGSGLLLTVPFSEEDPTVAQRFNDKLARSYMFAEDEAVIDVLLSEGITQAPSTALLPHAESEEAKLIELKAMIAQRVAYREYAQPPSTVEEDDAPH